MSYLLLERESPDAAPRGAGPRHGRAADSLGEAIRAARERNRAELGLAGLGAASVLASAVREVRVRTQLTPEVTWRPGTAPAGQSGGGLGEVLLRLVRPDVEVQTTMGTFRVAPYGQADSSYWPLVASVGAVVGGAGLFFLGRGMVAAYHDLIGGRGKRIARRR